MDISHGGHEVPGTTKLKPNAAKRSTSGILVAGGAGFIGSHFVRTLLEVTSSALVSLDKCTYATGLNHLSRFDDEERHRLVVGDIGNRALIRELLHEHRPVAVVNFAAETHVDRSILFPEEFVHTNVVGTFNLLEEVRQYWQELPDES